MATFNFVGKKCEESDKRTLFGADDVFLDIQENETNMAHLLARIGKFASVKDAKRNGWDKPIPTGWAEFTIGKGAKRTDVYIWNPTCTLEEFDEAAFDAQSNMN